MLDTLLLAFLTIITAATPLLFAALGEMITEKSGVLNLGVEGMMLMGAIGGFIVVTQTDSILLAIIALLVSILVPALNDARAVAKRSVCATNIQGNAVEM